MEQLTNRELEVLFWIANGRHPDEVSMLIGVSRKRVNNVLYEVRNKLEVHTTAHAVAVTMKRGYLTLEHIYDTQNPPEKSKWLDTIAKLLAVMVFLSGLWVNQENQQLRSYRTRPTHQNREMYLEDA